MVKPKFPAQTEIIETTMKSGSPQTNLGHIPSKRIQILLSGTKWCESHQKQIRNALRANCTTINAIIVTWYRRIRQCS